jgi:hypothetical protein
MHPLHDPSDRVLLAPIGDWELRQFGEGDSRLAYFAKRGFAHVQLWHLEHRVSIVTPSRFTGGHFECWLAGDRFVAHGWESVEWGLGERGLRVPGRHAMRAIERWFVLPHDTMAGQLLRRWWNAS